MTTSLIWQVASAIHNQLITEELSPRIRKVRVAFSNSHHLWRRRDIRLSTKGRVYCTAQHSTLSWCMLVIGGWLLSVKDLKRLTVVDRRCSRSISRVKWPSVVGSTEIRRRVLGKEWRSINEVVKLQD